MRKTTPDACRTHQNRPNQWWRSRLLALAALGTSMTMVAARPVDPLVRRQDTTTPTATTDVSSSVSSQDTATTDSSATDALTSPTSASTSMPSTSSDTASTTSVSSQSDSSSTTITGATSTSAGATTQSGPTSPVDTITTRTSTTRASTTTSTVATPSPSTSTTPSSSSTSTTSITTTTPSTTTRSPTNTSTSPSTTSSVISTSTDDPVASTSSSSSTASTSDTSTSSDATSTTTTSSTSDTTTTLTGTSVTTSKSSTSTSDSTTATSDSTTSTSTTTTLDTTTTTSDTTTTTSDATTTTSEPSTTITSTTSSDTGTPTSTNSTSISTTSTSASTGSTSTPITVTPTTTQTSMSETITTTSSAATSTSESSTSAAGTSTSTSSSPTVTQSSSSPSTSKTSESTTSSTSEPTSTSESSTEFTSLSETTLSSTTSSATSSIHVGNPADPSTTRTITGFHTSTIFQTVTTVKTGDSSTWTETTVVQSATLVPNGPSGSNSASFAHNPGAIAGTSVGILLLLVAIGVWAFFARRRANTRRMEQNALAFGPKDDVFRPPLDESDEDLSRRPALMSERIRGGRRSTITPSGLAAFTPASTVGYDPLARAAPEGTEDDGLMSEEEIDEDGVYSTESNYPEAASSNGHYVTALTTPMPMLGTTQDPMDGTAVAGAAAAGTTVLGEPSQRRSGPPSPSIPRSRPLSDIEPGMWYTGKVNAALMDIPASPGFSSGDGHDSNGGMTSSSQGHPQTYSSGHEPISGLNTRTSSDLQHGVWRPVGYGSSGSSNGHDLSMLQLAPRRPLASRVDQSGSGSGSGSDPRRSFSPSREYGQGSGSSVGHGIAAVARAGESGSSTGHGMISAAPILVRQSREITRTPSPKIGSRSGSSHGHGTSSHGHGGPPSSQGHEASSSGHGHQRRSGQPSRVSFAEKDFPPTSFRSRMTNSPTALRSTPSSPIPPARDEPPSRTGSTRSSKSYIKKSLRGRFSRRKSDAAKLTVDTDASAASSSRGPTSARSLAPVPTFFQSPQAAAHEHLMSQNIHISPPNSPILASSGATSSPLPPGAGYALPRPGSLGQFPNWQPTLASLAHDDARNTEDETAWAWPGLSPGVTLPPLPSPGVESVNVPEGLLDPALASRLSRVRSANHSTAAISLGDHEDYTRPIGVLSQQRMNSSNTVQTRSSQRTFDTDTGSHYSTHTVQGEHTL